MPARTASGLFRKTVRRTIASARGAAGTKTKLRRLAYRRPGMATTTTTSAMAGNRRTSDGHRQERSCADRRTAADGRHGVGRNQGGRSALLSRRSRGTADAAASRYRGARQQTETRAAAAVGGRTGTAARACDRGAQPGEGCTRGAAADLQASRPSGRGGAQAARHVRSGRPVCVGRAQSDRGATPAREASRPRPFRSRRSAEIVRSIFA